MDKSIEDVIRNSLSPCLLRFSVLILVKKSDWTLGEDISSAEVLVYNKNHKDVGGCYYPSGSIFK